MAEDWGLSLSVKESLDCFLGYLLREESHQVITTAALPQGRFSLQDLSFGQCITHERPLLHGHPLLRRVGEDVASDARRQFPV